MTYKNDSKYLLINYIYHLYKKQLECAESDTL